MNLGPASLDTPPGRWNNSGNNRIQADSVRLN